MVQVEFFVAGTGVLALLVYQLVQRANHVIERVSEGVIFGAVAKIVHPIQTAITYEWVSWKG